MESILASASLEMCGSWRTIETVLVLLESEWPARSPRRGRVADRSVPAVAGPKTPTARPPTAPQSDWRCEFRPIG
jgi:hypothetical protein